MEIQVGFYYVYGRSWDYKSIHGFTFSDNLLQDALELALSVCHKHNVNYLAIVDIFTDNYKKILYSKPEHNWERIRENNPDLGWVYRDGYSYVDIPALHLL